MNENMTTENETQPPVEPIADNIEPSPIVEPTEPSPDDSDAVRALRDELAKRRIKAREQVTQANQRLASAFIQADGRLIDSEALMVTDDLVGADGLVDGEKVTEAIDALLAAKPYLSAMKPSSPIVQGVQPQAPDDSGLFTFIRERL